MKLPQTLSHHTASLMCTIFYFHFHFAAILQPFFFKFLTEIQFPRYCITFNIQNEQTGRRNFLQTATAITASTVLPTAALAEITVPEQSKEYTFPSDWGLTYNYEADAAKVRNHMVIATGLAKGSDRMEDFGKNLKKEMIDFVSYYRRFPNVAGKPSFSTLYTSINVLAGHYTSYGYKYPLPEKRRKRLYQEYAEIDKSLKRNR
mmetsp:Transcript_32118/g.65329  ORF Transcript_32118/g.65329 Transcript_32118/m.65329 type:complete len:204 (+) Transcript_32118:637-1248(+)